MGQVVVGRRKIHVMINLIDVFQISAGRLNGHEHIAVDDPSKMHPILVDEQVAWDFSPVGSLLLADTLGQHLVPWGVPLSVGMGLGPGSQLIGRQPALVAGHATEHVMGQFVAVGVCLIDAVAVPAACDPVEL